MQTDPIIATVPDADPSTSGESQYDLRCCRSVDEQARALPGWNQTYDQLERGDFAGEVIRFDLAGVSLYRESLSLRTENHFCDPDGSVSVYFRRESAHGPVVEAGVSRIRRLRPFVFQPGQVLLYASFPEAQIAASSTGSTDWALLDGVPKIATTSVGDWLDRLLSPKGGARFREDAQFIRLAPKILHDQVSSWFDQPGWSRGNVPRGRGIVRDLLAWLRAAPIDLVSAADAAEGTGQPLVLLREACRTELDMTLERLLLVRRLNLVRRALMAAGSSGVKVSDVALDHGFTHWGRFAAHYREFLNERPSDTLRNAGARGTDSS